MHLRVSALAIFWETPLNWSTTWYNKLLECQLLYALLHYLSRPVNMVANSILPLWKTLIFCDFENAFPRKCSGHFLGNSTQVKYYGVLQTGLVSASVLICTPLFMTCIHGRKFDIIMIMWKIDIFQFSECTSAWVLCPFSREAPLKWITPRYYKPAEYSISFSTQFFATCHALQTWSQNRIFTPAKKK